MMTRLCYALGTTLTLLVLTATAWAENRDEELRVAWLKTCISQLAGGDDAVAESAAAALASMSPDAAPELVRALDTSMSDAAWGKLASALARKKPRRWAKALRDSGGSWPNWAMPRLGKVVQVLKEAPFDATTRAKEILKTIRRGRFYTIPVDPRVEALASLGRDAIPAFVWAVREHGEDTVQRNAAIAACEAWSEIATLDDLPLLEQLLTAERRPIVARVLRTLNGDRVRTILLAQLRDGNTNHGVMLALASHASHRETKKVVLDVLTEYGASLAWRAISLAHFCQQHGYFHCVPALKVALLKGDKKGDDDGAARVSIASALATLGVYDGFDELLLQLRGGTKGKAHTMSRRSAGFTLNSLTGTDRYHSAGYEDIGNAVEAAKKFEEFIDASRETARYHKGRREWVFPR